MTIRILKGDVREVLKTLPEESVDTVITSPPYWGLRNYGIAGQIGLEPTLAEHLQVMVEVFREIRRVLKSSGNVFLNYGDCYATTPNGRSAAATKAAGNDDRTFRDKPFSTIGPIEPVSKSKNIPRDSGRWGGGNNPATGYLKPKDLCLIPNRLAIALQEDGWWVRSEIIWGKNNPMPDSAGKYRPSTAHEKIFLLSKTGKMFYNPEAVAMPCSENTHMRISQDLAKQIGSARANGGTKTNGNMKAVFKKQDGHSRRHAGFNERYKNLQHSKPRSFHKDRTEGNEFRAKISTPGSGIKYNESFAESVCLKTETRYLRNYEPAPLAVWEMSTAAFSEAHFATFPPELVERAIKAGCPENGLVLDPFGGAGTTGLVADRLQRNAILIDLNPEYTEMALKRIKRDCPLFTEVEHA